MYSRHGDCSTDHVQLLLQKRLVVPGIDSSRRTEGGLDLHHLAISDSSRGPRGPTKVGPHGGGRSAGIGCQVRARVAARGRGDGARRIGDRITVILVGVEARVRAGGGESGGLLEELL